MKNILLVKFRRSWENVPRRLQRLDRGSEAPGSTTPKGCITHRSQNSTTSGSSSIEKNINSNPTTFSIRFLSGITQLLTFRRDQINQLVHSVGDQHFLSRFIFADATFTHHSAYLFVCEFFLCELLLTVNRPSPLYSSTSSLLVPTSMIYSNCWNKKRDNHLQTHKINFQNWYQNLNLI